MQQIPLSHKINIALGVICFFIGYLATSIPLSVMGILNILVGIDYPKNEKFSDAQRKLTDFVKEKIKDAKSG